MTDYLDALLSVRPWWREAMKRRRAEDLRAAERAQRLARKHEWAKGIALPALSPDAEKICAMIRISRFDYQLKLAEYQGVITAAERDMLKRALPDRTDPLPRIQPGLGVSL